MLQDVIYMRNLKLKLEKDYKLSIPYSYRRNRCIKVNMDLLCLISLLSATRTFSASTTMTFTDCLV